MLRMHSSSRQNEANKPCAPGRQDYALNAGQMFRSPRWYNHQGRSSPPNRSHGCVPADRLSCGQVGLAPKSVFPATALRYLPCVRMVLPERSEHRRT